MNFFGGLAIRVQDLGIEGRQLDHHYPQTLNIEKRNTAPITSAGLFVPLACKL